MDAGWWTTTMNIPGHEKGWLSIVDKSVPGNYTVNKNGHRFSNESQNYVSFVTDMFDEYEKGNPCAPCYMIFDSNFRKNSPCGPLLQASMQPDSRRLRLPSEKQDEGQTISLMAHLICFNLSSSAYSLLA